MLYLLVIGCLLVAGCQSDIKNPPPMRFSSTVSVDSSPRLTHTGSEGSGGTGRTRNSRSCI